MTRLKLTPRRLLYATFAYVAVWCLLAWVLPKLQWRALAANLDDIAWSGFFLIGLCWAIWCLERLAQRAERRRLEPSLAQDPAPVANVLRGIAGGARPAQKRIWNPIDPAAWYYGRHAQRFRQSLSALALYCILFTLLYMLIHHVWSGVDPYELPAGGGQEMIRQTVQVKKIIKKKYVINPYSSIKFNPPPIEQIDVKLVEESQNLYQVGQGAEGGEAGFGQGTSTGKVRFIRLKHSDRAWDKNFGIGGDRNMLSEYAARTRQKVGEQTESIEIAQLGAFPPKKSPPLVYVGGGSQFSLSLADKKVLRQYLTERHGMILGDNLGGSGFHQHFIATLNEVTGTTPVPIPRDDRIHQLPYRLPDLPIVVAHGGTIPLGWKIDGRWVAYYHPGALSDAWRDDHAGIKKEIYEMCYQLGVNVIYYAHREYNTWLKSQQP